MMLKSDDMGTIMDMSLDEQIPARRVKAMSQKGFNDTGRNYPGNFSRMEKTTAASMNN